MTLNSKQIILGVIILCSVVLSTTFYFGEKDNINSETNFENYLYAKQLINTNQAEKATGILTQLDEQYPKNVFIKRNLGLAYALSGDSSRGTSYFQDCIDINPAMQRDAFFMFQYGEILYYDKEYKKARVVLTKSLKLKNVNSYKKQIKHLLSILNKKEI